MSVDYPHISRLVLNVGYEIETEETQGAQRMELTSKFSSLGMGRQLHTSRVVQDNNHGRVVQDHQTLVCRVGRPDTYKVIAKQLTHWLDQTHIKQAAA